MNNKKRAIFLGLISTLSILSYKYKNSIEKNIDNTDPTDFTEIVNYFDISDDYVCKDSEIVIYNSNKTIRGIINKNTKIYIINEDNDFYNVITENGIKGYVYKNDLDKSVDNYVLTKPIDINAEEHVINSDSNLSYYHTEYYNDQGGRSDVYFSIVPKDYTFGMALPYGKSWQKVSPVDLVNGKVDVYDVTGDNVLDRINAPLAINISLTGEGIVMVNGEIIHNDKPVGGNVIFVRRDGSRGYTPDSSYDSELGTTLEERLRREGAVTAAQGFEVIYANGKTQEIGNVAITHPDVYKDGSARHQRTFFAELNTGEMVLIVSEGRFGGDAGMSRDEMIDFVFKHVSKDVKWIMNFDGGGSTIMVADGKKIDANHDNGTSATRNRPDMLYVKRK